MGMSASLHTDRANKHPLRVQFGDATTTKTYAPYITLRFQQTGEGDICLFAHECDYGDLIVGLEDTARRLREIIAHKMVQTWGFAYWNPNAGTRLFRLPGISTVDNRRAFEEVD